MTIVTSVNVQKAMHAFGFFYFACVAYLLIDDINDCLLTEIVKNK